LTVVLSSSGRAAGRRSIGFSSSEEEIGVRIGKEIRVKDLFAPSKSAWAVVEYYDQGTGAFQLHFDSNGTDTAAEANPVAKHDTKAWTTHTFKLAHFGFTQAGPGGADIWLDDTATDPLIVDKITVTDQDPDVTHWPHVDPAHPIKIDGVISPGEWDAAYTVTLNTAAQDALAGANWGGPQDFSGTYYYKWDESGLYVRGDVTDATPRLNDQAGDQAWNGDGFEEFLSLDWSDPTHTTYLDGTDFHVFIGLGDTPMWGIEHAPNSSTDDKGAIPAQNLAIKNTDNPKGYQFEFYLPWQFLLSDVSNTTTKIMAGQQIGWFMFANNSTVIGPSQQQVAMSPYKRTGPSGNPSVWATVVLDPFQAQPVANPPASAGGITGGSTAGNTTGGGSPTAGQ
jgi:hypothetical protein